MLSYLPNFFGDWSTPASKATLAREIAHSILSEFDSIVRQRDQFSSTNYTYCCYLNGRQATITTAFSVHFGTYTGALDNVKSATFSLMTLEVDDQQISLISTANPLQF